MSEETRRLEQRVADLEKELQLAKLELLESQRIDELHGDSDTSTLPLTLKEYQRYGRQMILEGMGLPAQLKLKKANVLVVGAGGLGCPAIQYLAAAGIGTLGIVDHDVVELSNLQRQILHSDSTIGWQKTASAKAAALRIDPRVKVVEHPYLLSISNARATMADYDIILDCTDNLPTRYLLSDMSVLLGKPLVSGAALKFDGQLCVYNLGLNGPCFRCIFPKPAARTEGDTCEAAGVLGAVTGVIGTLQAMEAIKIIVGLHGQQPKLLIFSALSPTPFRSIKMRSKSLKCPACNTDPSLRDAFLASQDYVAFCGGEVPDPHFNGSVVKAGRIGPEALQNLLNLSESPITLIDVRPATEFTICSLPGSTNIPFQEFLRRPEPPISPSHTTIVVCRLGNDSQLAADMLRKVAPAGTKVWDLIGGLRGWTRRVDPQFPVY